MNRMRTYGRLFLVLVPIVLAVAGHTVRSDDQTDAARNTTAFSEAERSYWAFQSVANPQPPLVKAISWPKSPLDHFILAQLESNGLEPAPAADKRTLIRRASFDLIGLPPTPEEIDAFLADESPGAFARVVDRLLASPHYGERWGRHWLDVARYADSNGMDENLIYGNAFRYRDYVIAAFNKDKPYDQFIREQLAGDLLAARSNRIHAVSASNDDPMNRVTTNSEETTEFERVVATGFLSIGPKMLAEDDPVKMEMDIIDEQIDTIGRTIMGLTLGCARCHDHKYDPLRTEDYYSLAGIFKSTQTMDNFKVVARWHERPLGSKEAIARQQAHEHQIGAKKTEISRLTEHANDTLLSAARRRVADYLLTAAEVQRRTALQKELKSVLADPVPPAGSVPVIIEAEQFTRGNVKKEFTGYGEKIGVIYNQGELPNFAEYDINVVAAASSPAPAGDGAATEFVLPAAPAYQLELRYAAAESRPVKLLINGQLVKASAAGKTTGTWYPDSQSWTAEGVFRLSPGKNTIRLERAEPFPHF
ncbi:MAG: DUF1549 domain-containing protein, partial [Planctomycetes bacterium]|nr:DUF1549 domain-containing protein [Planctomycetota bacterium]